RFVIGGRRFRRTHICGGDLEVSRGEGRDIALLTAMPLFDTTTRLALRYLPRDKFTALRGRYFAFRAASSPVQRAIYGSFDSAALKTHLEQRVGRDFEILMVHSSVNYLKPMYDADPLEFVQMLIEFCGA